MWSSVLPVVRNLVSSNSVRLSIVIERINVILTDLKKVKCIISPLPIFTELPHPNLGRGFCQRLTALMLFVYIWNAAKEVRQIGKIYILFFPLCHWKWSRSIEILCKIKHFHLNLVSCWSVLNWQIFSSSLIQYARFNLEGGLRVLCHWFSFCQLNLIFLIDSSWPLGYKCSSAVVKNLSLPEFNNNFEVFLDSLLGERSRKKCLYLNKEYCSL